MHKSQLFQMFLFPIGHRIAANAFGCMYERTRIEISQPENHNCRAQTCAPAYRKNAARNPEWNVATLKYPAGACRNCIIVCALTIAFAVRRGHHKVHTLWPTPAAKHARTHPHTGSTEFNYTGCLPWSEYIRIDPVSMGPKSDMNNHLFASNVLIIHLGL